MGKLDDQVKEAMAKLENDPAIESFAEMIRQIFYNVSHKGMRPLEAMGLKPESLERLYNNALKQYQAGQFVEAAKALRVFTLLCPTEFKFVFALAACNHRAQDYAAALAGYHAATIANPLEPLPYYHAADCLAKLGFPDAAAESLRIAIKNCTESEQHAMIREHANLALKNLQQVISAGEANKQSAEKEPEQTADVNQ